MQEMLQRDYCRTLQELFRMALVNLLTFVALIGQCFFYVNVYDLPFILNVPSECSIHLAQFSNFQ